MTLNDSAVLLQADQSDVDGATAEEAPRWWGARRRTLALGAVAVLAAVACGIWHLTPRTKMATAGLLAGEQMEAWERLNQFLEDSGAPEPPVPEGLNATKLAYAQCVVDVAQAIAYLGQAVVWLDKAVTYRGYQCPDNTQRGCAVSVEATITALSWVASYLALTASSCSATVHAKAACAADVTGVVANLGELATASTAAADDCHFEDEEFQEQQGPPAGQAGEQNPASVHRVMRLTRHGIYGRRLSDHDNEETVATGLAGANRSEAATPAAIVLSHANPSPKNNHIYIDEARQAQHERNLDIALCTFDAVQGISYIIRAAKQIMGSIIDGCGDPKVCTVNVFNIISSLAWLAQFMSFAAADCAYESNQAAYCAGDISDLVAATTSLVAIGIALEVDCEASTVAYKWWGDNSEVKQIWETKRRLRSH